MIPFSQNLVKQQPLLGLFIPFRRRSIDHCPIVVRFSFSIAFLLIKGIQAVRIELKVANIRCFILIAVGIFHNIIRKQPRTKEIRRCFIVLNPVKNPMFTRAIFIRPDSELIRDSVCACAKLLVDEESTWHKSNRGIEQKH